MRTPWLRAAALALVCLAGCPKEEVVLVTADPDLTIGHGALLDADGRDLSPGRAYTLGVQEFYIRSLLEAQPPALAAEAKVARDSIHDLVGDDLLAGALYVEWLVERVKPENEAHIVSTNGALRRYYLDHLESDERSRTGLDAATTQKLADRGVPVLRATYSAGRAYVEECRAAGVPIPPPVFSSAWQNRGILENEFLSPEDQAELLLYTSESPRGACLALPRYDTVDNGSGGRRVTDDIDLLGLICLGIESSKACFWDNPAEVTFRRGAEIDISRFVGGTDLVGNDQGICSDCHAGENPFVVHKDKPPFEDLTSTLMPVSWYDPLVHATWPQNPGPTSLLAGVASPQKCDSCHAQGYAGRFPQPSTQLKRWCEVVLEIATGTTSAATMPPGGGDRNKYLSHIAALKAACDQPPAAGVVVEVSYPDDPGVVSPVLIVDAPYACATDVVVRGAALDAKLSLLVNGATVGTRNVRNPNHEEFPVAALATGDILAARQELEGVVGPLSAAVTVRDHRLDYPTGLPAPEVDPGLIYECAGVIAVRHVRGAEVTIHSNGTVPVSGTSGAEWTAFVPGKQPFVVGDAFTAEQRLCEDRSGISAAKSAVSAPLGVPAPLLQPEKTWPGQQLVTVVGLTNGARVHLGEATAGPLGTYETPVNWLPDVDIATPIGRALGPVDQLTVSQELCRGGPTTETATPRPCDELPAPKLEPPAAGATYVVVSELVPGARIHVYDGASVEIGDGGGNIVALVRALVAGEPVTAVQQLGDCTSRTGHRVNTSQVPAKD